MISLGPSDLLLRLGSTTLKTCLLHFLFPLELLPCGLTGLRHDGGFILRVIDWAHASLVYQILCVLRILLECLTLRILLLIQLLPHSLPLLTNFLRFVET